MLTGNGSCYRHGVFRMALRQQNIEIRFTRRYMTPINRNAERFLETVLGEWVYASSCNSSSEHEQTLDPWLHDCNCHRHILTSTSTQQSADPA